MVGDFPRSQAWMSLIDAANDWQQCEAVLSHCEGDPHCSPDRLARARADEVKAYDHWHHCLVAHERYEGRNR